MTEPRPAQPNHAAFSCGVLLRVALATPAGDFFDYLPQKGVALPAVGSRALVPFGARRLVGLVVAHVHPKDSDAPLAKLKAIVERLDDEPIVDARFLDFARWLSGYYHYPLGETLATMLPTAVKQGKTLDATQDFWRLCPISDPKTLKSAKQRDVYAALWRYFGEAWFDRDALLLRNIDAAAFGALQKKQLVLRQKRPPDAPCPARQIQTPPALTDEQQRAVDDVRAALDEGVYRAFLIDGVTGSGKTEVYLQAIERALAQGKQALVLVPEIGLTPQTYRRFADRFCAHIVALHSGLSDNERLQGWLAIKSGRAQIVIATRSAIFYPFADLGLIVIDEAHDDSYKQRDRLRYHACDVAMYLAHKSGLVVVLGSATPSLEHLRLCQEGKLTRLGLSQSVGAKKTRFVIDDKKLSPAFCTDRQGERVATALSAHSALRIQKHLQRGEQVLVFLNRRGYAPVLLCQSCGYQADCVRCASHLTLHKKPAPLLKCHHCGYQTPPPARCPQCHSANLQTLGQGTERLYEHLHALFANPQNTQTPYPILQIDKDNVRKKNDWQKIYQRVLSNEAMILVGTQMLAKGHHFPNVTLVVIVDADAGLLSSDFRAPEKVCQQITQVAGRAGRADKGGEVIIQSLQPQNPLLQRLIQEGYRSAADSLLEQRRLLGLPPYRYAAAVHAHAKTQNDVQNAMAILKRSLGDRDRDVVLLGPMDAPLSKKNHLYEMRMLLLAKQRQKLHALLFAWWPYAKTLLPSKIRLTLDVDPYG